MQATIARGIASLIPFSAGFGAALVWAGYGLLAQGYFEYIPRVGVSQIISPATRPDVFWGATFGPIAIGSVLLLVAATAVFLVVRALRGEPAGPARRSLLTMFIFSVGITVILFAMIARGISRHHPASNKSLEPTADRRVN
jgi:drug/metabolite transporter (DMT)-like permease